MSGGAIDPAAWDQMQRFILSRETVDQQVIDSAVFDGPSVQPLAQEDDLGVAGTSWVVVRCPDGHNVSPMRLVLAHDLEHVELDVDPRFRHRVESAVRAENIVRSARIHLSCAQKRHRYRSTWTRDELVKRLTVALMQRRPELHLD